MRLLMLIVALLMSGAAAPAVAGPFEDGLAAHGKGDYATALRLWRPLAEQGNARAQYNLGLMYDTAGACQDYVQAASWYRKAADQGDADAQFTSAVYGRAGRAAGLRAGAHVVQPQRRPRRCRWPPRTATSSPRR